MWNSYAWLIRRWNITVKSKINYLLIGNSRWHFAINKNNYWEYMHVLPNLEIIEKFNANNLKWACVGELPNHLSLIPNNRINVQDIPLDKLPEWIGVDRALGAWGALKNAEKIGPLSKGIIVADAGTVLSMTCIDANGSFIGGQLMAGLNLNLSAMSNHTKNLKDPGLIKTTPEMFPSETNEAMQRGALQSLVGALSEAQLHLKMPLWLCGGDSKIIFEELNKRNLDVKHLPNLVLEGMIFLN